MALPTQAQLHRPILEIVVDANGILALAQLKAKLAGRFDLSENDLQELTASGQNRFLSRIYWAVSYLRRAELLHSPSPATFIGTPEGQAFLNNHFGLIKTKILQDLIDKNYHAQGVGSGEDGLSSQSEIYTDSPKGDLEEATPDELIEQAANQIMDKLVDDLVIRIRSESYTGFELLVLDVLRNMGYGEPKHTGKSGDGGVDGVMHLDALGLEKVCVQAKRWSNPVPPAEIQKFAGSLDTFGIPKGVFITTSTFSENAIKTAETISTGAKYLRLIDGRELARLMIRHGVGVVIENTYEIKKLDENYFAEDV